MDETVGDGAYPLGLDESYRPLPSLYLAFLSLWLVSACSWTLNTYKKRRFQACSLWMSFGVYVTGVLFQTAAFVSFLLIAHGYCIMCEHLSLSERRTTAALGCVFYLTLVGYKACVPYFTVLLLLNYFISFYVIFRHISQNLLLLREQLSIVENEDVRTMHDALYTKYMMFKKFQGAMQIVAMAETVIYMNMDDSSENYCLRLLVREWAQFCIFSYIGWTFRSQDLAPRFSVMPATKYRGDILVPPIYSIEMDAATFKDFSSHEWHIGVPNSACRDESPEDAVLVIIEHPHSQRLRTLDTSSRSADCSAVSNLTSQTC
ncbi:uncharacterized protein LOC129288692 isoform X2 [Prosopis cineraria]|uniref:uncharacterized protein LOC129288692 isoform X2 n=1 Tax=Prosopis cineraria TaxID=364024 RepID=UPI00240F3097|nr:uncharacterized protein LOC129288692 isoform X2 [Prosopis cineraria]